MKSLVLTNIFSWLVVVGAHGQSGGAVGNGGDTVFCESVPAVSPFVGYYNLDYLMNVTAAVVYAQDFEKVIGPKGFYKDNLHRIVRAFEEKKYLALAQDLHEFGWFLFENKFGERYMWKKAPYGVTEVSDEQLRQRIPPNCLSKDPKTSSLIQTILRVPKNWKMTVDGRYPDKGTYLFGVKGADFTFSEEIFVKLSHLQISFLLFHEWLRNFTDDPEVIRDANAIFHSEGWTGDDIEAKMKLLDKVGLHKLWEMRKLK